MTISFPDQHTKHHIPHPGVEKMLQPGGDTAGAGYGQWLAILLGRNESLVGQHRMSTPSDRSSPSMLERCSGKPGSHCQECYRVRQSEDTAGTGECPGQLSTAVSKCGARDHQGDPLEVVQRPKPEGIPAVH